MIKDYGFLDNLELIFKGLFERRLINNTSFKRHEDITDPNRDVWCVFLPWHMKYKGAESLGFAPEDNIITYSGPVSLAATDPHLSRKSLFTVFEDYKKNVAPRFKNIKIVGFSLGEYPAVYIANHFEVKSLTLVSPGAKLGQTIWKSLGTRKVKRLSQKLGFLSADEYDNILGDTNPISNIDNLPKEIEIHLGTHDKYILYKFGKEFSDALKKKNKKHTLHVHQGKGHIATMLESTKEIFKE